MKDNKKGIQLNQAFSAVLTLVLVAVLIIIGIYMFTSLGATFTNYQTVSVINETGTINAAGHTLANSTVCNYAAQSVSAIWTSGGTSLIPPANYTVTGSVITNATLLTYTGALVSYSHTWGGPACTASATAVSNFSGYPALIGLVGTIIFLGIVIGVLVASFVFGRKEGA